MCKSLSPGFFKKERNETQSEYMFFGFGFGFGGGGRAGEKRGMGYMKENKKNGGRGGWIVIHMLEFGKNSSPFLI